VTASRRGFGAGALIALAALLLVVAGAVALLTAGGDDAPPTQRKARGESQATATPKASPAPEQATPTATPSPSATAAPEQGPGKGKGKKDTAAAGDDPAQLQLQAFNLNKAGKPEQALPYAQKAVDLCKGSTAVSPCAYALFEYARALRLTGDPERAIAALEERKQRFPDNQPDAVEEELARAREAAGEQD
jgi:tetratricopeptide (TPR) repeat protein